MRFPKGHMEESQCLCELLAIPLCLCGIVFPHKQKVAHSISFPLLWKNFHIPHFRTLQRTYDTISTTRNSSKKTKLIKINKTTRCKLVKREQASVTAASTYLKLIPSTYSCLDQHSQEPLMTLLIPMISTSACSDCSKAMFMPTFT